jgi:hypothetical protein
LTIAQMHATSNTELIRLTRTWSFVKALGFSEMEALALVLASKLEYAEQLLRTATELATVDDRPLDGMAAENAQPGIEYDADNFPCGFTEDINGQLAERAAEVPILDQGETGASVACAMASAIAHINAGLAELAERAAEGMQIP